MLLSVALTNRVGTGGTGALDETFVSASLTDNPGPIGVTALPDNLFFGPAVITCNATQDGILYLYVDSALQGTGDPVLGQWNYTANDNLIIPVLLPLCIWWLDYEYAGSDNVTAQIAVLGRPSGSY